MEAEDGSNDVVHPEVRAHIGSLISALGGASADDDGRYKLGDDALEVLRDLKRWIRFYDEKTNRMDVARCMAEANLIEGDLLPIIATWTENSAESLFRARVALACFELMLPLTWPLDRDPERMTKNHHRHVPVLHLAQLGYKRAIINYDGAQVLNSAVRVALPAMAVPAGDRSARDQGIIKLALFFLRNVAAIAPGPDAKHDADDENLLISRSATIEAFAYQDIFLLLLTVASNVGDDFRTEDVVVMEIIFHLVKRVDVGKLFMDEQQLNKAQARDLTAMMAKEAAMLSSYKKGSGRHNRFGAMIWVKRDGGKMSTVSGSDALVDAATRHRKLDSTKSYRPPQRPRKKGDGGPDASEPSGSPKLSARANDQLRSFVEDFLDSGFNPLFLHLRKTIDRDAPHLLGYHRRQFFYLAAWFLRAERMRRARRGGKVAENGVSSFNLVAGVLNQEMFVALSRALHQAYDNKDWSDLTAVMRCFTAILLTVQEMRECGIEEDEEIAENALARLFYEDATHDMIANVVRTFKDQHFDYLDAATELTHHFLRILEAYSKQNVDMQVRTRRARRRKRKAERKPGDAENPDAQEQPDVQGPDGNDDSENDAADAERTSKERRFDFNRFLARFGPQGVVDTFVAFTKHYRSLDDEQLKRAHRYFYRVAFKQEKSTMLFRVDIIHLLHGMIRGPEPLDKASAMYKEWEELSRQVLKRCVRTLRERPQLVVEMLFSKISSTVYFLEKGHDMPKAASSRPGAEMEFRGAPERDQQIAIVVGAMLDKNQTELLRFVRETLADAAKERRRCEERGQEQEQEQEQEQKQGRVQEREREREREQSQEREQPKPQPIAIETPTTVVRPPDNAMRMAIFRNPHLRLLMKLSHITRLAPGIDETPDSAWIVASSVTADELEDTLSMIQQAEFSPPVFDEGVLAEHQLKRKTEPRKRAAFDDDDGDGDGDDVAGMIDDGDEPMFPAGGPTARRVVDADGAAPKKRRLRRRKDGDEEPADSEAEEVERRRKRREKEREKANRIKSAVYVTAEDDEDDEEYDREFYAREEEIRRRARNVAATFAADPDADVAPESPETRKMRALQALDALASGDSEGDDDPPAGRTEAPSDVDMDDGDEGGSGSDEHDGAGGGGVRPARAVRDVPRKRRRLSDGASSPTGTRSYASLGAPSVVPRDLDVEMADDDDDDDDDDSEPVVRTKNPRARAGVVLDSDDDE